MLLAQSFLYEGKDLVLAALQHPKMVVNFNKGDVNCYSAICSTCPIFVSSASACGLSLLPPIVKNDLAQAEGYYRATHPELFI